MRKAELAYSTQFRIGVSSLVGNFVVVWQSDESGDEFTHIFGQRFSSAGLAQGQFMVNVTTAFSQQNPAVTAIGA